MSLSHKAAASFVRHTARRQQLPAVRQTAALAQQQQRTYADGSNVSHAVFNSPFHRGKGDRPDTTVIPSFKKYRSGNEQGNKVFQYFMIGSLGGISAMGAKDTVQSMQHKTTRPA